MRRVPNVALTFARWLVDLAAGARPNGWKDVRHQRQF
jgi:hypothetical protein